MATDTGTHATDTSAGPGCGVGTAAAPSRTARRRLLQWVATVAATASVGAVLLQPARSGPQEAAEASLPILREAGGPDACGDIVEGVRGDRDPFTEAGLTARLPDLAEAGATVSTWVCIATDGLLDGVIVFLRPTDAEGPEAISAFWILATDPDVAPELVDTARDTLAGETEADVRTQSRAVDGQTLAVVVGSPGESLFRELAARAPTRSLWELVQAATA